LISFALYKFHWFYSERFAFVVEWLNLNEFYSVTPVNFPTPYPTTEQHTDMAAMSLSRLPLDIR